MVNKTLAQAMEETKTDMTPMIDVTFQLIIFFMCSIKFKVLEGKLQTYLPKDVGVNTTPIDTQLDKVDVRIVRTVTREQLNLDDPDAYGLWKKRGWVIEEVNLSVMGQPIRSLADLETALKRLREATPAPPDLGQPGVEDPLKMNVEAMSGTLYEDVVRVVDVAIAAGFTSITFRGIEKGA
jgi:biopolymer transport protein ExbD